jgi:sugar lactone lactonase YvrE
VRVVGSEFGGDNGLAAAPDGSVIYINGWSDGTLRIVPLKKGASAAAH